MKTIIIIAVLFFALVFGVGTYLSPDDIAKCGDNPGSTSGCESADAIVAVSGGDTAARTQEAVKLYQNGWAPKLIFSGAAQDKTGPSNAEVMRRAAIAAGVPMSDIITEEYSQTTKENAEKTQSIFERSNISSVILVTSAYHQRRAGLEFNKRSANVQVRNHPVMQDMQWSGMWWLTPIGWYLAAGEVIKITLFYVGITR